MSNLNKSQRQSYAIMKREEEERMPDHPGFKAAQARIAKRRNPRTGKPYGKDRAGAILAAGARRASPEAKAENPRLRKVPGA